MKSDEIRRQAVTKMLTADGMLAVLDGQYKNLHKVDDTTVAFEKGTANYVCRIYGSFNGVDLPVLATYTTVRLPIPDSMQAQLGRDQSAARKVTNIRERSFDRDSVTFDITYEQIIESCDTADTLRTCVDAGIRAIKARRKSIFSWVRRSLGIRLC